MQRDPFASAAKNPGTKPMGADLMFRFQNFPAVLSNHGSSGVEAAFAIQVNQRAVGRRFGVIQLDQAAADTFTAMRQESKDTSRHGLLFDFRAQHRAVKTNRA